MTNLGQDGQLQLPLLYSLLGGFLSRKRGKSKGSLGSHDLTSHRDAIICINPLPPAPSSSIWDGKTFGAEHDSPRALNFAKRPFNFSKAQASTQFQE